jgi:hypothetical protein
VLSATERFIYQTCYFSIVIGYSTAAVFASFINKNIMEEIQGIRESHKKKEAWEKRDE